MDWGPDGRLYGPRWFTNEVVSVDVDTGNIRKEASGFNVPLQLNLIRKESFSSWIPGQEK